MNTRKHRQRGRWVKMMLAFLLGGLLSLGQGDLCFGSDSGSGHSSGGGHSPGITSGHGGSSSGRDSGSDGHSSGHSGKKGHQGKGGKGGPGHVSGYEKGHGGGAAAVKSDIFGSRGRRPVWAQEGLPEVELGRLNVSRAPGHVLARALDEARATLAADPAAEIHSPLQNLAIYLEAMQGEGGWTREQAAAHLGAASDKRIPITTDTVTALNLILGVSDPDPAGMAQSADQVRQAILQAHDAGGGDSGH